MNEQQALETTLDSCIQSGIDSLRRAKFAWWPAQGNVDSSEDNLWFHVCWALQNSGFHVYAKVQVAGLSKQHIDAVAVHRDYRCAVAIEAKRLYSGDKHESLGKDWERLKRITLPCEWLSLPQPLNCYAVLLGSCWSENYANWWKNSERPLSPLGARETGSWSPLLNALREAVRIDAINVQREGWQPHWVCFAVNRFPVNHWCPREALPDTNPIDTRRDD